MSVARRAVLLLAAFACCGSSIALIDDVIEVLGIAKEVVEKTVESWDFLSKQLNLSGGVELPLIRRMERKLLGELRGITRDISALDLNVDRSTMMVLSKLMVSLPQNTRLELRLNELTDLITRVNNAERQMQQYVEYEGEIERLTLENFATWAVSHEPGAIPGLIERIHALTVTERTNFFNRGVLSLLVDSLKESQSDLCNLKQSSQQLLYNMYITISLTEIKGYTMMQFSWMLLKIYGKGNFTQEANLMRNRYEERTSLTVASIKSAMANAKRDMWRCDPSYYEEGETYTSITQLLQGYIENEVDMNSEGTCKENCVYYTLTKNHGCFKDQYCARQAACSGRIISCQYIDSDMSICPATRNTGRRYEWIEYENGRTLGRPGSCMRQTAKVDSWWRWLFWHCSYCLCLCDEQGRNSDRYISLHESLSDVKANKVVTGIRFIKKNRIIHLQINEGTLLPRANIDPMSVHWKSIENMDIRNSSLVSGVDYHTLTYEKRAIDLDDLEGPTETVLTGVRFSMVGPHLHFEIRVTPFNYSTGNLQAERSVWISNDNTDGAALSPRTKKELYKPDIPSRSNTPSVPDTTSDQYMEFTHSDYDADAAQTTVPFIDIQPVMPSTPLPLVGAGIFHKGQKGYGGFFAPKVFTYDYSKHMQAVFPPINKPLIQ